MTELDIDFGGQSRSAKTPGFWRRQFMPTTTGAQRTFDVIFGLIAPVLCFTFDPIVFRDGLDRALFPEYQPYAYMVSGLEILLLVVWMVWGRKLQPHTRMIGGMLISGALFSIVLGVIILPFSLLGLFLGIGIFGFIPFLTGLVYLRNGRSALQLSQTHRVARPWIGSVVISCVVVLGAPAGLTFIASHFVSQSMNAVIYSGPQTADMAIDQIKYLRFFARPQVDRLVSAYLLENEQSRKDELKRRYLKLTGEDIDEKLRILAD